MKDLRDWVDVAFKVVLAVVGILVGYYFSFQKQQNDDIKLVIDMATSGDRPKSLMAISIADAYLDQRRIPQGVYVAVTSFLKNSDDKSVRVAADAAAVATSKDQPGIRQAFVRADSALPIRIYFHIRDENDRAAATSLGKAIEGSTASGHLVVVPGVELVDGAQSMSLLKCFKKAECDALGSRLVSLFTDNNLKITLSDQSATYGQSDSIRSNHFEAWFAPGLQKALGIAKPAVANTAAGPATSARR